MFVIVVLTSLVVLGVGLAAGALVSRRMLQEQHQQQIDTQIDSQAAAVEAAVRQVLAEREATASATAAAVTADREATVSAAVQNAVEVATAQLDARMQEGSKELDLRSTSFNDRVESIGSQLDKVQKLVTDLQREKAQQHGQLVSNYLLIVVLLIVCTAIT